MKSLTKTVVGSGLMVLALTAVAADKSPVTSNVALTTNYVWRGVSQSAKHLAIQGGFDYAHSSGFYLGTWGSNVDFGNDAVTSADGDGASMELDVYGGYKFTAVGVNWDVGVMGYRYPGANSSLKYDFNEIYVGGGYGPFSLKYSRASDYQGVTTKSASYLDAALNFELPQGLGLGLHLGKSSGDGIKDAFVKEYTDSKISLSKEIGGFGFSLAYTDTNFSGAQLIKKGVSANDGQWMLTVSKSM